MLKLKLEIEIGNDAMMEPDHVADLLDIVAGQVRELQVFQHWPPNAGRTLQDANGNTVGRWSIRRGRRAA